MGGDPDAPRAGDTVFLTTHYLEEADALCDRLAIIDHGLIVAEGTSDQLKQKVAGDVVTIGVNGAGASVLTLVEAMPFVREASHDAEAGLVRLYVDRGETAVAAAAPEPRRRGVRGDFDLTRQAEPRRCFPPPDRALAARGGGMTANAAAPAAPTTFPRPPKGTPACERSATPG